MSVRTDYEAYLQKQREFTASPLSHYWINQEQRYVEPFRIYGNVYYVGDSWVCAHLIDTGDGLLLIDGGNCGAEKLLIHAIWSLGFNPGDVRWMILSHGHLDHIGAVQFFRRMFGTRIYMGEPDAVMFRERPELSCIQDNPDVTMTLFEPDEVIREGDVLHFGNVTIDCKLVPGHTPGCVALFFDVTEDGVTKRAGYFGGFGLNTLQTDYLRDIGDSDFQARRDYIASLEKVRDERVELFLGNHTANNNLLEKAALLKEGKGPNPFLDDTCWRAYMDDRRAACLALK
ncbi:MAG: MBL fold metallo-hydrolase [Dysosmobacter sp.]|nr:MBL fold metallo-hydrolase [Dysosmobacter sp.]